MTKEVSTNPFALMVRVKVDRDVGGDEISRPLVHEVEEAKVADGAEVRRCVVFCNPKGSVTWCVLQESWATCLNCCRFEVATAFACSYREVVDLDHSGQVGFGRIAVGVGHEAQCIG